MISSFLKSSNVSSGVECTAESDNTNTHKTDQDVVRPVRLRFVTRSM